MYCREKHKEHHSLTGGLTTVEATPPGDNLRRVAMIGAIAKHPLPVKIYQLKNKVRPYASDGTMKTDDDDDDDDDEEGAQCN